MKVLCQLKKKNQVFVSKLLAKSSKLFSDKVYIKIKYRLLFGKGINLETPLTFNEKLNWLKLNDHNPLYKRLADKYEVKEYVSNIIGKEYVVPTYGIWDSFEDINFETLPNQFVLKATHNSGGVTVCKDKKSINIRDVEKLFRKVMSDDYFWGNREWVYKDLKPRIIADLLLDDHSGKELRDYKFLCFNGVPQFMYCTNKSSDIFENFYDMDFNPVNINHGFRRNVPEFDKPIEFELMKTLATKLSKGIPFVRVDFFDVDGNVYFGEFTFYDWAGFRPFDDEKWDYKLGSMLELPSL